jgi:hypothetical protein
VRRQVPQPASFAPQLRRLGRATPPPFVGRDAELAALTAALVDTPLILITGAVGAGKTRLAHALCARPEVAGFRTVHVTCGHDEHALGVIGRAERLAGVVPGGLADALGETALLVILDDVHRLAAADVVALAELGRSAAVGRLVLSARDVLPLPRATASFALEVDGLDEAPARDLWSHLEATYGPTPARACDAAIARTRGTPLALRHDYALAAFGDDAWSIEALAAPSRRVLEALAILDLPAGPAVLAALCDGVAVEGALIELVSRQLVDPRDDGRFALHDIVRDRTLAAMPAAAIAAVAAAAADLVAAPAARLDDGALPLRDAIDRLAAEVRLRCAAGQAERASSALAGAAELTLQRGAARELGALVAAVDRAAGHPICADLAATLAVRRGAVAAALALGGTACPVVRAELDLRACELATAEVALAAALEAADPDRRCRAAAVRAELLLDRGEVAAARGQVASAFEDFLGDAGEVARARLQLALAAIEEREGSGPSARAALGRAAAACRDGALAALIDVRRAASLIIEDRLAEAEAALASATRAAVDGDAGAIRLELVHVGALIRARRGGLGAAADALARLVAERRGLGDELGALRAEIDRAAVEARRGQELVAGELAAAAARTATALGLGALAARASLILAALDVTALRNDEARAQLDALADAAASDAALARERSILHARLDAVAGAAQAAPGAGDLTETREALAAAGLAGEPVRALALARRLVVLAERSGRGADLADGLAALARFELAAGGRDAAQLAATRAAREASTAGATRAHVHALLALAALARDGGDVAAAASYAGDAAALAGAAGMAIERLAAAHAIECIGRGDRPGAAELPAAAATMTAAARDAARGMMSDLGLTLVRPFRLVGAAGTESRVADAGAARLRIDERDLVVDGVREAVVRGGRVVADLKRRTLLKRLLFLFAGSPGKTFSKEEIVRQVWELDYHPLRHDAALFTNIMRIRRLLGADGADLIRVNEEGYRFVPGDDFLFVSSR